MSKTQQIIFIEGVDDLVKIKPHGNTDFCNKFMMEINPTIGCQFQCQYCNAYTQEEENDFSKVVVYKDYPIYLKEYLEENKEIRDKIFFYYSPKIDCLQDCLIESGITESILKILKDFKVRYFLVTKGKIPPKSIQDLLISSRDFNQIIISCTMPNEDIRKKIEPFAATIEERLEFAKFCVENGIFTTGIFSPIFPVEGLKFVKDYIKYYISIGINHFRLDFTEISRHSLTKLIDLMPEYEEDFKKVYLDPRAEKTYWNVPFKHLRIERYWPSIEYMKNSFTELSEYAKSLDKNSTVSVCNSLCAPIKLNFFNNECMKRGINCIGVRFS